MSCEIIQSYKNTFFNADGKWCQWLQCADALIEARDLAREHDFELMVLVLPILVDLDSTYPFQDVMDLVLEHCRKNGIPATSMLPDFIGEQAEQLWVSTSDQHPNERGHSIIAHRLYEELTARGSLLDPGTAVSGVRAGP